MTETSWITKLKKPELLAIAKMRKLKKYSRLKKKQLADLLISHYSAVKIQKLKKNGNCPFTLEPAQHPFYKRTTFINKTRHVQFYNLESLIFYIDLSSAKTPTCPVTRIPFSQKELREIRTLQKINSIQKRPSDTTTLSPNVEQYRSILDSFVGEITNLIAEYHNNNIPYRAVVGFVDEAYMLDINRNYLALRRASREAASDFYQRTENTILQEPQNELRDYFLFVFRTLNNIQFENGVFALPERQR
tara:strand:+ start:3345 stop:4085 length:741 start_codon:yes stop_codon:yes gene_type:complete